MLLKNISAITTLLVCGAQFTFADTVLLKDKSSVTGKILAEKSDAVVVDVGYTVLVVPRNAINRISKASETNAPAAVTAAVPAGQFYAATTKTSAAKAG